MKKLSPAAWLVVMFLTGVVLGLVLLVLIPPGIWLSVRLAVFLLCVAVGLFFFGAVHEAGHMIAGWIGGYRFVSFRIGSVILYRCRGKLKLGKRKLAGTSGQCLMAPREDKKQNVILYLLGGPAADLISAVLLIAAAVLSSDATAYALSCLFAGMFLISFLLNAIPLSPGGIPNDGENARRIRANPAAARAVELQLRINEASENGISLSDMPREWFLLPPPETLNEPQMIGVLLNCGEYAGSIGDREGMIGIMDYAIGLPDTIPLHRLQAEADLMTALLLTSYEEADYDPRRFSDPRFSDLFLAFGQNGNPSVALAESAYHALIRRDPVSFRAAAGRFERALPMMTEGQRNDALREMQSVWEKIAYVLGEAFFRC